MKSLYYNFGKEFQSSSHFCPPFFLSKLNFDGAVNKHLGPKGNSEDLNVARGEAEGNIEVRGETKLTVSRGAVH